MEDEILEIFNNRQLNYKTNNMIIVGDNLDKLLDNIPNSTSISFLDYDIDINYAINIKINLKEIRVNDILSKALDYLNTHNFLDVSFDYELPFTDKFSINKFRSILQNNNMAVQLIFYNLEILSKEEQMLFNELYYYNSAFFNVTSFTENGFSTYFLTQYRVLDDRENYQKYEVIKPNILLKKYEF